MKTKPLNPAAGLPACLLFKPSQVLLWVPEFSGNRTAFQSYNHRRGVTPGPDPAAPGSLENHENDLYGTGFNRAGNKRLGFDARGVSKAAPFSVSDTSPSGWNDNCGTHYALVPLKRSLTGDDGTPSASTFAGSELEALCLRVCKLAGKTAADYHGYPLRVLKESRLPQIRQALREMGLLANPNR